LIGIFPEGCPGDFWGNVSETYTWKFSFCGFSETVGVLKEGTTRGISYILGSEYLNGLIMIWRCLRMAAEICVRNVLVVPLFGGGEALTLFFTAS
jgi:hypothetical protein